MKVKKLIQSTTGPLEELLTRGENLDFRLDEDYWRDLQVGDVIEYWEDFSGWDTEPSEKSRRVRAETIDIIKASSFNELMEKCERIDFDEQSKKETFEHLRTYWSAEKEQEIGVLGLYVRLVK